MTRHLMFVAAALLFVPTAIYPQRYQQRGVDLTGFWQDNAGGKYEIRQVGNQMFWLDDARPRYANVFYGTISGNTIHGTWADLPGGRTNHTGSIDLRVESNDRISKISSSVYFGGSVFTRTQGPTSQGAYPQGPANGSYPPGQGSYPDGNGQAPSIVGHWQTSSDGTSLTIRRDGSFTGAGTEGRWRELNSNDGIYELTWSNGTVNRVRLSADGQQLEDSSRFGTRVIATRVERGERRNRDQR